jgi:hypothetical protein
MLNVRPGENISLEVRHAGFKPLAVDIDGSEPRKVVQLERVERPAPSRPPVKVRAIDKSTGAGQKKKGSLGAGEIVNPWDR